ncbi:glycoside hydrolase family 28 protein [Nannocystis pusilla]|uniref:glycoside hydrolase family 28 protein n=1 Tax=Nannocystis pusilla TaxID=889268 RepID=UPI003DA1FCE3
MTQSTQEFDVATFGAVDDGETDAAQALSKAWQAAKDSGKPGRVVFRRKTRGVFLLSPLSLAGGQDITLLIGKGVTLSALPYDKKHLDRWSDNGGRILRIDGVRGFSLIGEDRGSSIVQGNGPSWPGFRGDKSKLDRPRLIQIDACKQVVARDFTMIDSPNFNLVFKDCEGGEAMNITIDCPTDSHNTDAIHLDASVGFKVHDCEIRCGDDAIAINSPGGRESANHEIWNLKITGSHGISIGSSIVGAVHDLNVHDITMNGAANGIRIKSKPENTGTVRDATYARFDMTDVDNALVIQNGTYGDDERGKGGASLDGITVTQVVARGGGDVRGDRRRPLGPGQELPDLGLPRDRLQARLEHQRRPLGHLDRRRRSEVPQEVDGREDDHDPGYPRIGRGRLRGRRRRCHRRRRGAHAGVEGREGVGAGGPDRVPPQDHGRVPAVAADALGRAGRHALDRRRGDAVRPALRCAPPRALEEQRRGDLRVRGRSRRSRCSVRTG